MMIIIRSLHVSCDENIYKYTFKGESDGDIENESTEYDLF